MEDHSTPDMHPNPRELSAIFNDLRALCQSEGALHSISALIYRDWVLTIDTMEGRVISDPERRWSTSKLNNNEMMLMAGLLVQSQSDTTYSRLPSDDNFATKADKLLREFHDRLLVNHTEHFDLAAGKFIDTPEAFGAFAQEAIYYGADSFYLTQYESLARHRYREDSDWLLARVGLSIRPMLEIARYIVNRRNVQMTHANENIKGRSPSELGELTSSLLIYKSELLERFGDKAKAFLAKFAIEPTNANLGFSDPFKINFLNARPLIDLGECVYVLNEYRLMASIYESPFYWMNEDKTYKDKQAEHRGNFLERTATHLSTLVFGKENVFQNVTIKPNKTRTAAEADTLIVFGEFVIVLQAKSKRVTLKARAGDTEALKADFEAAVQHAYRQAYEFAHLIRAGAECTAKDGRVITFEPVKRVFPIVLLSDPFPSITILADMMLKRSDQIAPAIWDIGVLDTLTKILPTPIEFIYYLKCRSDHFDDIHSDSEYNFLGFHLKTKLAVPPDYNFLMIDRDFAGCIDDFMIAKEAGVEHAKRPEGILENLKIPIVKELLTALRSTPPKLSSIVIDLYDFSSNALESIAEKINSLRSEVTRGKEFKSFSIPTETGGITYMVCRRLNAHIWLAAEAIGKKYKYDTKRDRWYVIVDSVETPHPIDGLLPIVGAWQEDETLADNSAKVSELFKSSQVEMKSGTLEDPASE